MGLFDKFKVKKEPKAAQPPAEPQAVWDNAFRANINFYQKEGGRPLRRSGSYRRGRDCFARRSLGEARPGR